MPSIFNSGAGEIVAISILFCGRFWPNRIQLVNIERTEPGVAADGDGFEKLIVVGREEATGNGDAAVIGENFQRGAVEEDVDFECSVFQLKRRRADDAGGELFGFGIVENRL